MYLHDFLHCRAQVQKKNTTKKQSSREAARRSVRRSDRLNSRNARETKTTSTGRSSDLRPSSSTQPPSTGANGKRYDNDRDNCVLKCGFYIRNTKPCKIGLFLYRHSKMHWPLRKLRCSLKGSCVHENSCDALKC